MKCRKCRKIRNLSALNYKSWSLRRTKKKVQVINIFLPIMLFLFAAVSMLFFHRNNSCETLKAVVSCHCRDIFCIGPDGDEGGQSSIRKFQKITLWNNFKTSAARRKNREHGKYFCPRAGRSGRTFKFHYLIKRETESSNAVFAIEKKLQRIQERQNWGSIMVGDVQMTSMCTGILHHLPMCYQPYTAPHSPAPRTGHEFPEASRNGGKGRRGKIGAVG